MGEQIKFLQELSHCNNEILSIELHGIFWASSAWELIPNKQGEN